jgi:hypothetical protein
MIADLLRTGKFNETQLRTGPYAELQDGLCQTLNNTSTPRRVSNALR